MRLIEGDSIIDAVSGLVVSSNYNIGDDMIQVFENGMAREKSPVGREIFRQILENAEIARSESVPYCQDTGFSVFFVDVGEDVQVKGNLTELINEGVRRGYKDGYLRKSILGDPLKRVNTGDNTPAIIHYNYVAGDKLTINFGAKGGGSENMSRQAMLKPSDGEDGVKDFVVDTVSVGGANACPPLVVGVGIGGTFEGSCILAKKAAMRPPASKNGDPYYAAMEEELTERCNKLGIGPMGLGGTVTVLGVNIETHPCHLASLPVAVNINCHADRHGRAVL
ncbi:MAG: fumarate hydratase [Acidobacteriota bacterium]|jgi:fumarate hydratase subunit alpha